MLCNNPGHDPVFHSHWVWAFWRMFESTTNTRYATTLLPFPVQSTTFLPVRISPYQYGSSNRPRFFASTSLNQHPNNIYNKVLPTGFFRIASYNSTVHGETKANTFHRICLDLPIVFLPPEYTVTKRRSLFPFCR